EGANGVGKTSLVNVAGYSLFTDYLEKKSDKLFIPCNRAFQLSPDMNLEAFVTDVYLETAQTLLQRAPEANAALPQSSSAALGKWLNSPNMKNWQIGSPWGGLGGGTSSNTSVGFERSGFFAIMREWLSEIFPDGHGGVICTIDNLELLQTSDEARNKLEQLRDMLFVLQGFRWVICGASGLIYTAVSSPRLEGLLHSPIEIGGIDPTLIHEVFDSRIRAYALHVEDTYLPLATHQFQTLYTTLNRNLRSLLHYSDEYCMWASDRSLPQNDEHKESLFMQWLSEHSKSLYVAAAAELTERPWCLFDVAIEKGGRFAPSDYGEYGFNSPEALRPHVKALENVQLLTSLQEDKDKRRKSISITPKGYLVNYYRKQIKG
ncbi:MAG TPA: hypothetical protein PK388_05355, partial [Kiritimatiellia bacterium]|nr:hypothetical protein [Kiritimatiellia bacterium]